MFKKITVIMLALALVGISSSCGFKNRKGYYYDNHRFNYVRVVKFKGAKDKNITQPFTISEAQMSTLLKSLSIKKGAAFSKDDDKIKEIFTSESIAKLTPALVRAFSEVQPNQKIQFGFLVKNPLLVLKNDRFSNGDMWVEDGKIHIDFDKIFVKITGDIDKRGYSEEKMLQQARGLRVSLELGPGQEYGSSTQELVVDTAVNAKVAEEVVKRQKELTISGVTPDVKVKMIKDPSVKEKLKELDALKKEHMITDQEYIQKRKEILGEL